MNYLIVSSEKLLILILSIVPIVILPKFLDAIDFGIISICMIINAGSLILIDSGLGGALIKKRNVEEKDYCTVFALNIFVALVIYLILYLSSDIVSEFFNMAELKEAIKLMAISIIINSLYIVQKVKATKKLLFKSQAVINTLSTIFYTLIVVFLAAKGYKYHSIIIAQILCYTFTACCYMFYYKNISMPIFYITSLVNIYKTGSAFIISGLVSLLNTNILALTIGKFFGLYTLGLFNRAYAFNNIINVNFISIIDKVLFPSLSKEGDSEKSAKVAKNILKIGSFIAFFVITALLINAAEIVDLILGEKWNEIVIYLEVLCLSSYGIVINSIFKNIIKSKGDAKDIINFEILFLFSLVAFVLPFYFFTSLLNVLIIYAAICLLSSLLFIVKIKKLLQQQYRTLLFCIMPSVIPTFISILIWQSIAELELTSVYSFIFKISFIIVIFILSYFNFIHKYEG